MPTSMPEEKIIKEWLKLGKKMPKANDFATDLVKITVPKIKMHAALTKIQKDIAKLEKDFSAVRSEQNKAVDKGNAWLSEVRASMTRNISASEISARKNMLLKIGVEMAGALKNGVRSVEKLAKAAVKIENDAFGVKKEIRKAENQLKKSGSGGGSSPAKAIILGKKTDASDEDLKQIKAQVDEIQKKMSEFGSKLTKAWKALTLGCAKVEQATKFIRTFRV